ncbi:hypothetical protein ATE84_2047 [Aquimarina sp. MAR_2010_214]|uniref:collagen-like protein n=1 Tax=Aquimarina sp. MAR_2010_214 TaxID=1250026 RepID=UPI000C70D20B|nr:collagen-like protein [Aquimarina sp. MAR_2010_214]PKV50001.1 hypothetical protein ATE84_2047 [Aquimarina sp. MAR_2010_214]
MKTKKLKHLFLAFITLLALGCSDGEDGAIGPQGEQGVAGSNGTNGQDGNANVRSLTYDLSAVSGTFYDQSIPEFTQEVIDNDAILGYLKLNGSSRLYPIPNTNLTPLGIDVRTFIELEKYSMDFYNRNASTTFSVTAGQLDELRIVIIASTNRSGEQQDILSKLKTEGVDINDYYAVMKYFNK